MIDRMEGQRGVGSRVATLILVLLGGLRSAHASEVFPGAVQEAGHLDCVPSCLLCHTTNPGNATSWQAKKLPLDIRRIAGAANMPVKPGDEASMRRAFSLWMKAPENAAALALIRRGKDPQEGRNDQDICTPQYGCGAHVAKHSAPRDDFSGAFWTIAAIGAAAVFLRRGRN
jgi:hypothetical protein